MLLFFFVVEKYISLDAFSLFNILLKLADI